MRMKTLRNIILAASAGLVVLGCSKGAFGFGYSSDKGGAYESLSGGGGGNLGGGGEAGVITAAEWNDLANWQFWGNVMTGKYSSMNTYWGLNTAKRIAVKLVDSDGEPIKRMSVKLLQGDNVLWEAVTDNKGTANLWLAVTDVQNPVSADQCTVSVNGQVQQGAPKVWKWDSEEPVVNTYTVDQGTPGDIVDIAFIVDATGSMADEIGFLKADLQDILTRASLFDTSKEIFTGTVFYRDTAGDEYLTRTSAFTSDISSIMNFIKVQNAEGGGDTPEAVHTALEVALSQLQWHSSTYSSLAFLILDAPAHKDHQGVVESLQKSIKAFSAKGIKIIPVFCSSGSKDCEFMARQFAILTNGTYVFLTDDSGVGGDHIEATVGDYQIEHLNKLIVRLITDNIS